MILDWAGNDTSVVSLQAYFDAKNRTGNTQISFSTGLDTKPEKSGICNLYYCYQGGFYYDGEREKIATGAAPIGGSPGQRPGEGVKD